MVEDPEGFVGSVNGLSNSKDQSGPPIRKSTEKRRHGLGECLASN